jgi:hypothetical protein
MEEIQNHIEESTLRWFGLVIRTDEHRIPKKTILEMKISGRRPRGRPSTQWIDQVKTDVGRKGQIETVRDSCAKDAPQVR